jgi:hypothetical protein
VKAKQRSSETTLSVSTGGILGVTRAISANWLGGYLPGTAAGDAKIVAAGTGRCAAWLGEAVWRLVW